MRRRMSASRSGIRAAIRSYTWPARISPRQALSSRSRTWRSTSVVLADIACRLALRSGAQVLLPGDGDRRARHVDEHGGGRGARLLLQAHARLARQRIALAAVAWRARRDDVVPARATALGPGDHVIDGQVRARPAVLAGPVVAGEHGAARDLAPVRVARDPHVADEPDHHRTDHRRARGVEFPLGPLDHLGLVLEEQNHCASDGADVDRLVCGVQHEHPANLMSASLVLWKRRGPHWRRY